MQPHFVESFCLIDLKRCALRGKARMSIQLSISKESQFKKIFLAQLKNSTFQIYKIKKKPSAIKICSLR